MNGITRMMRKKNWNQWIDRTSRMMFRKRKNNRNLWLSLIGIGVGGATLYGLTKGKNNRWIQTLMQKKPGRMNQLPTP